jgi:hypothetical protein
VIIGEWRSLIPAVWGIQGKRKKEKVKISS